MNQDLQQILAGKGTEFFMCEETAMVSYQRRQYELSEAPEYIHVSLDRFLIDNPDKAEAYEDMAGKDCVKDQCVKCLFGNLNGVPDLTDDGVFMPEYVECPKRGSCKWEGIGCMKNPFGLSKREQEIADLAELTNAEIADKLYLSKFTVSTHLQNIQRKTGAKNKKQLIKIRPSLTLQQWK